MDEDAVPNVIDESIKTLLINRKEAAKRLGLKVHYLALMLKNGQGPKAFKIGRRYFYTQESLEAWTATLAK